MKKIKLILFAAFAIASIAAPLSIIWKYEAALRYGTIYKFRTKLIDPNDAFRGKYIALSFEDDWLEKGDDDYRYRSEKPAYVRLAADADGFAKPMSVSKASLEGDDIIRVDVWQSWDREKKRDVIRLDYPFRRYYLAEDIAPTAEKLYRRANTRAADAEDDAEDDAAAQQKPETYVTVSVYKGVGVLKELYLNGVPVREAVKAELEK